MSQSCFHVPSNATDAALATQETQRTWRNVRSWRKGRNASNALLTERMQRPLSIFAFCVTLLRTFLRSLRTLHALRWVKTKDTVLHADFDDWGQSQGSWAGLLFPSACVQWKAVKSSLSSARRHRSCWRRQSRDTQVIQHVGSTKTAYLINVHP